MISQRIDGTKNLEIEVNFESFLDFCFSRGKCFVVLLRCNRLFLWRQTCNGSCISMLYDIKFNADLGYL
jgi:hypothetical protein